VRAEYLSRLLCSADAEAAAGEREERLQDMLQQSMTHTAEARQDLADKEEKLGQVRLMTCLRRLRSAPWTVLLHFST
jgi:hypothetical protein